ncbi:hypothetical protein [Roseiconus lacunae]|uniref:Uncharacterized protein n=1 Tax=Roseiconus lacunae TaxID=2605694 RepID=A0ABT7PPI1_9BACT|nr:hypothetical protein [Roseiconus lacunae]MDM4018392.1 hypothetical protein [Roseiconus lacunae]
MRPPLAFINGRWEPDLKNGHNSGLPAISRRALAPVSKHGYQPPGVSPGQSGQTVADVI